MKRYIPASEDWRTDTDDPQINDFRQIMIENAEHQDDPYVGIFWYDIYKDELFGVIKSPAAELPFKRRSMFAKPSKTCQALHENVWRKARYKKKPDPRFNRDYTKVPRGRVFQINDKFVVMVGDWVDMYPQVKNEVLYEFQLPEDTEFRKDVHWNIGHGWSEEKALNNNATIEDIKIVIEEASNDIEDFME